MQESPTCDNYNLSSVITVVEALLSFVRPLESLMLLHSYLFTRYSFDQQIANANRGGQIFFSLLTYFNYTGNKTEKKKHNMKRQKDTHEKQKRKIANVHCKGEKVLEFLASSVSMVPFGV